MNVSTVKVHASWLAGGSLIGSLTWLIATLVVARLYEPDSIGQYALWVQAASLAAIVATLQLDALIPSTRTLLAARLLEARGMLLLVVLAGPLSVALIWLVCPPTLRPASFSAWASVVALTLVLAATSLRTQLALRYREVKSLSIRSASLGATVGAAQVVASLISTGSTALATADAVGRAMVLAMTGRFQVIGYRDRLSRDSKRRYLLTQLRHTPLAIGSRLAAALSVALPVLLLGAIAGPSWAGYAALVGPIVLVPHLIAGIPIGQALSTLTSTSSDYRHARRRALVSALAVGLVSTAAYAFAGPAMVPVLYGSMWGQAGDLLRALSPMALAGVLWAISATMLIRSKLIFAVFVYNCTRVAAMVICSTLDSKQPIYAAVAISLAALAVDILGFIYAIVRTASAKC